MSIRPTNKFYDVIRPILMAEKNFAKISWVLKGKAIQWKIEAIFLWKDKCLKRHIRAE